MLNFFRFALIAVAGLALGLFVSALALTHLSPFDRVRLRAWSVEARAGSVEADPYTRARIAQSGEVPLAIGEGLKLIAREDDTGRPLDARCVYRIGPRAPAARYWTLSVTDPDGFPIANPAERYGFRSSEVLRSGDGDFAIVAAAKVQPGDWLPIGAPGPFALVLRLYDSPLGATAAAMDPASVPRVTRLACE